MYRQKGDAPAKVFLDPNTFSEDGTVSLSSIEFSKDGSLAVYLISEGGSDWRKARIIDTETQEVLESELVDINSAVYHGSVTKAFITLATTSLKVVSYQQKLININCITMS